MTKDFSWRSNAIVYGIPQVRREIPHFCSMKRLLFFLIPVVFSACSHNESPTAERTARRQKKDAGNVLGESRQEEKVPLLLVNGSDTLVQVNRFNNKIFSELKYATSDNFMHRILYDTLKAVYVQQDVAKRLGKCQELLSSIDASLHLLVYDGVRPLSVQWEMWEALDTIPAAQRGKFVSNPRNGSVHNYGAAVDLTICTAGHRPLDMGAGYDDIRTIAYPSMEATFLGNGQLTREQVANRQLLRRVMRSQGFINIPTEWWHFNAWPRAVVKGKYAVVRYELTGKAVQL